MVRRLTMPLVSYPAGSLALTLTLISATSWGLRNSLTTLVSLPAGLFQDHQPDEDLFYLQVTWELTTLLFSPTVDSISYFLLKHIGKRSYQSLDLDKSIENNCYITLWYY